MIATCQLIKWKQEVSGGSAAVVVPEFNLRKGEGGLKVDAMES
jgi:hypothetical protein